MHSGFCRICGYLYSPQPWGSDGQSPIYEICPCCGVEFGNEDYSLESIRRFRISWINGGAKWYRGSKMPDGWSLKEQLKNIPEQYF